MQHRIQLPLDPSKRHFVVGDIHGRYEAFIRLLDQINYDETTDLIYSVGDLIDRGPQSVEVLKFFEKPNTWAVRGNHEQMVVNIKDWMRVWMHPPNGGPSTVKSLEQHNYDFKWLQQYCSKLPLFIDVGEHNDPHGFRIIHAEIPYSWSEEDFLDHIELYEEEAYERDLLWGRVTIMKGLRNLQQMRPIQYNITFSQERSGRTVFCGHTPINKPLKIGDTWWIDTYRSGTLSLMNAITHESFMVQVFPHKTVK